MNEKRLVKLSVIGTVASILILYVMTGQIFSSSVNIGDIDKSFTGKTVDITGEITSISSNKGSLFISVKDETGEIKVVLWEDIIKSINADDVNRLNKGSKINVIGGVQIYRGEMEIIPIRGSVKIV